MLPSGGGCTDLASWWQLYCHWILLLEGAVFEEKGTLSLLEGQCLVLRGQRRLAEHF